MARKPVIDPVAEGEMHKTQPADISLLASAVIFFVDFPTNLNTSKSQ